MVDVQTGFEVAILILVGALVVVALGRGLAAAERRGWIRLHGGAGKSSAAAAFAAMEDLFYGSRSQARQLLEAQKLMGHRAPTPGDGLGEGPTVTGRYSGKVTIHLTGSPAANQQGADNRAPTRGPLP